MKPVGERYAIAVQRWRNGERGLQSLCQELDINPRRLDSLLRDEGYAGRLRVSMTSHSGELLVGDVLEFLKGYDSDLPLSVVREETGVVTLSIEL